MTKVQAILIKSNAPKYLWGKAILATIYIYNKTPHNTLNFKTPYKIKHNKKPNINNIKIQGSITYYKIKGPKRSKLKAQAKKGILIKYKKNNYNYKIYNLKYKKIIWSRDIKIFKGQFLTKKQINNIPLLKKPNKQSQGFIIKKHNNKINNNNNNNNNNNTGSKTIITRSQTRNINSNKNIALSTPKITIKIPRKSNKYYNQFERILINNITNIINILHIKDTNKKPSTYKQAITEPKQEKQNISIRKEITKLENQHTQKLVNLPPNRISLGSKQVYKKKNNNNNNTIKYKSK